MTPPPPIYNDSICMLNASERKCHSLACRNVSLAATSGLLVGTLVVPCILIFRKLLHKSNQH